MRFVMFAAAAVLSFISIASASAADLSPQFRLPIPYDTTSTAIAQSWAGPYVGAAVGYSAVHNRAKASNTVVGQFDNSAGTGGAATVAGYAGYNWQVGRFVFGPEVDFGTGGKSGFMTRVSQSSTTERWQGSARLRLGYAWGQWLPYLTGGAAVADIRHQLGPVGGPLQGYGGVRAGWTVGGGIERRITDHLVGRVEYRHTDYGVMAHSLAPLYPTVTARDRTVDDRATLGISWKF